MSYSDEDLKKKLEEYEKTLRSLDFMNYSDDAINKKLEKFKKAYEREKESSGQEESKQKGKRIGWSGSAAEPRVITIWDKKDQKEQLERMESIKCIEDFDDVFEEYIYTYDCDSYIWSYEGTLSIGSDTQKWEFNNPGEPDIMKILVEKYKGEEICMISFDVLKASGEFPTLEEGEFDSSQLTYNNGEILYKGEELDVIDNRGINSEKALVKNGKIIKLQ